jgi:hypothetical protein
MMRWWYGAGLGLCVCLLAGGCSGGGKDKTVQVSGKVELDGKPLDDGEIAFVGDAGTVPDILPVKAGAFEGKVKVGKKKVEIRVFETKKAPPTATGGATETRENVLPDRYNTKSTLTAEVTEGGVSPGKFEVQSK